MSREEYVLIGLAPARGAPHTPVQVQKLFFIVQTDAKESCSLGHAHFDFKPHHFGPFDKEVYTELENLQRQGLVEISFDGSGLRNYRLTLAGQARADALLNGIDDRSRNFVEAISQWIRKQSFFALVNTVYELYPETAVNSVFRR